MHARQIIMPGRPNYLSVSARMEELPSSGSGSSGTFVYRRLGGLKVILVGCLTSSPGGYSI